ncbi:MAG: PAS domain-containing protein [Actinomycetota bacterium]|nr:PAS domain-containing protein [Actinomycetota bacterium]
MSAPPIEMVLLKQVASYLAMPIFVVDAEGALEYYNEPAEDLLGRRYEEAGQLPLDLWGRMWTPTDSGGEPLPPDRLPLAIAVRERRPSQETLWIQGSDGVTRRIMITAIPINGRTSELIGALAIFWES